MSTYNIVLECKFYLILKCYFSLLKNAIIRHKNKKKPGNEKKELT